MFATKFGHQVVVDQLLEHNAQVNLQNKVNKIQSPMWRFLAHCSSRAFQCEKLFHFSWLLKYRNLWLWWYTGRTLGADICLIFRSSCVGTAVTAACGWREHAGQCRHYSVLVMVYCVSLCMRRTILHASKVFMSHLMYALHALCVFGGVSAFLLIGLA